METETLKDSLAAGLLFQTAANTSSPLNDRNRNFTPQPRKKPAA
jgi:hypothetical protein